MNRKVNQSQLYSALGALQKHFGTEPEGFRIITRAAPETPTGPTEVAQDPNDTVVLPNQPGEVVEMPYRIQDTEGHGTTDLQGLTKWMAGHPTDDWAPNSPLDGRAEIEVLIKHQWYNAAAVNDEDFTPSEVVFR